MWTTRAYGCILRFPVVRGGDRLPGGVFGDAITDRDQHPRRSRCVRSGIEHRPGVHADGDVTPLPEQPHRVGEAGAHL